MKIVTKMETYQNYKTFVKRRRYLKKFYKVNESDSKFIFWDISRVKDYNGMPIKETEDGMQMDWFKSLYHIGYSYTLWITPA